MTYKRLFTLIVMVIASMLALTTTVFSQEDAGVRFIHAVSGGSATDIYVNSQLAVANLSYGEASAYLDVPAGALDITVNAVGTSSTLFSQTITAEAGSSASLVAWCPGAP